MSVGSKGKAKFVQSGVDKEARAYKDALISALRKQDADRLDGPYSVDFLFWRKLEQYQTESGRNMTRKWVDATNMQKLCEDALQEIIITNDKEDLVVRSYIMSQTKETIPCIGIVIRAGIDPARITIRNCLPPDVAGKMEDMVELSNMRYEHSTGAASSGRKIDNSW